MKPVVDRAYGYDGYRLINPYTDRVNELPTKVCCHCGSLTVLNPERKRPRGHCKKCDLYMCDSCATVGRCIHDKVA